MASAPITFTVPFTLTVDVHEIDGGGFYGEVRHLPGCLAQAETLEDLADAIREALRDYFAEPGDMTEETARGLAAIQGTTTIPPGPYPLRRDYQPPARWTEADEDEDRGRRPGPWRLALIWSALRVDWIRLIPARRASEGPIRSEEPSLARRASIGRMTPS